MIEQKRRLVFVVAILIVIAGAVIIGLTSCAVPEGTRVVNITPDPYSNSEITKEQLIGYSGWISYSIDYIEDKERNVGCYVYISSESGSIFCFNLDELK